MRRVRRGVIAAVMTAGLLGAVPAAKAAVVAPEAARDQVCVHAWLGKADHRVCVAVP